MLNIGGMATMPSRKNSLDLALPKILPQLDLLYLYLDRYEKIPKELENKDKIIAILPAEVGALGAAGKFYALSVMTEPFLFFGFDDDIVYPDGYVEYVTAAIKLYKYEAMVGIHGHIYKRSINSYVQDRMYLHFAQPTNMDTYVDELGTGTIAFYSAVYKSNFLKWQNKKDLDLNLMLDCFKEAIPRICIRRPALFLQAIAEGQIDSIYREYLMNDHEQTRVINEARKRYPNSWQYHRLA